VRTRKDAITYGCLAALVVGTLGCTTHAVVRDTTRAVGGHVDHLSRALSEYARTLEGDAAGRVELLAAQRRDLAAVESGLQAQLTVWSLAGRDGELRLYDGVVKAAADAIAAERALADREAREAAALKDTQAKFDTQSTQFRSLVQQLGVLAESPGFREQSAFLFGYLKDIGDEIERLQAEAKKAADDAKKVSPTK
jgi:hypothetical protein